MTRKQALRLIRQIRQEDIAVECGGLRHWPSARCERTGKHYGCSFDLEMVDLRSGYPFVVRDPEGWKERVDASLFLL